MEVVERIVKELQRAATAEHVTGGDKTVNKVEEARKKGKSKPCYRCGKQGHASDVCRYKNATCHVAKWVT